MKRFMLFFACLLVLSSCQNTLTPETVSERYWRAVQAKDSKKIKQYSTAFWDTETEQINSLPEIESFVLGQIVINDHKAEVETNLNIKNSEPDIETIQLITYLIQTEGVWKVDYDKTMQGIGPKSFNDVIEELTELGNLLKDEFNHSLDEIDNAIPKIEEGISEFGEKIQEGIPELQNKLDELVQKLQDLLELPEQEENEEATTTEI